MCSVKAVRCDSVMQLSGCHACREVIKLNTRRVKLSPLKFFLPIAALIASFSGATHAATDSDIDKLTTYAVMLGRAVGCGLSTGYETSQVGAWMDERFPPGSADQQLYLPIFMAGVQDNAQKQSQGLSPDSCGAVQEQFELVSWP
ncbi:hypothetical protein D3C85_1034810 [compost metagenome]